MSRAHVVAFLGVCMLAIAPGSAARAQDTACPVRTAPSGLRVLDWDCISRRMNRAAPPRTSDRRVDATPACPSRRTPGGLRIPDWDCLARRGDRATPRRAERASNQPPRAPTCPALRSPDGLRIPDWECMARRDLAGRLTPPEPPAPAPPPVPEPQPAAGPAPSDETGAALSSPRTAR